MTDSIWDDFARPMPAWVGQAPLGIFIHWGPYSVPAWAEPSGALGTIPDHEWFAHNAYAEWYANTIKITDSPAADHHRQTYGDAPYDDFLDAWTAAEFDPDSWAELFAEAGAGYVVPTTKHHDGIALWDAPGTGTRNTVHRGPRRDLIGALAGAVRRAGLRFGVYYSGGLDWGVTDLAPIVSESGVHDLRPNDAAYNAYALLHVRDLMTRYSPDILWNDINWPDSGKRRGSWSLHELFTDFYAQNPEGIVNDRWGDTHWDYRTSEYEMGTDNESGTRLGAVPRIGFSFGYNQAEGSDELLDGPQLARLLADIVSRGGRLLLNVGPTAEGTIPRGQQESLRGLGRWMSNAGDLLRGAAPVPADIAAPSDQPWVRWLAGDDHLVALVDESGETALDFRADGYDTARAFVIGPGSVANETDRLTVSLPTDRPGPSAVLIPRRHTN